MPHPYAVPAQRPFGEIFSAFRETLERRAHQQETQSQEQIDSHIAEYAGTLAKLSSANPGHERDEALARTKNSRGPTFVAGLMSIILAQHQTVNQERAIVAVQLLMTEGSSLLSNPALIPSCKIQRWEEVHQRCLAYLTTGQPLDIRP